MAEDDRPPPVDTPERRAQLAARRGHPTGPHIRDRPHPDEVNHPVAPPPADAGTLALQVEALTDMMQNVMGRLQVGTGPAPPPLKPDAWKWIGGVVSVAGLCLTIIVQGQSIVSSNQSVAASNQKFIDRVEAMDERLHVVEKRQTDNIPRLDAQVTENKMQNDRINSIVDALADERRARNADNVETRKAQQDIMALIAKLADKVADIGTDVAVIKSGGRRTEIAPPVRDAQVMRGQ